MQSEAQHTVILFFSQSPEQEVASKPLWHKRKRDLLVYQQLRQHTLNIIRSSGLPWVIIDETLQQGKTFGEKLSHAFENLYALGYERVISIGNDCPGLTADFLCKAAATEKPVLGPAKDGGVYLIGYSKPHFNAKAFAQLPWQEDTLQMAMAAPFAEVQWLTPLADVDDKAHCEAFFEHKTHFTPHFLKILASWFVPFYQLPKIWWGTPSVIAQQITQRPPPLRA